MVSGRGKGRSLEKRKGCSQKESAKGAVRKRFHTFSQQDQEGFVQERRGTREHGKSQKETRRRRRGYIPAYDLEPRVKEKPGTK